MPSRLIRLLMLLLLAATLAGCDLPPTGDPSTSSAYAIEHFFKDPGAQALGIAAEHGNVAEVRRLMQQEHVDPDVMFASDGSGMPLLAWPIYTRNPDGLKAMLENGADPNARVLHPAQDTERFKGRYRNNAMVYAARNENPIYLKLLLEHGGNPDTRNSNGETLLFQAFIWHNQWQNVQLLVEHGADVNAMTQGRPILDTYSMEGNFEAAYWLLEHGADPKALDRRDGTAHRYPFVEDVFWHPTHPRMNGWKRKCQQWLLQRGFSRPPMPDGLRKWRKDLGMPYKEKDIPLLRELVSVNGKPALQWSPLEQLHEAAGGQGNLDGAPVIRRMPVGEGRQRWPSRDRPVGSVGRLGWTAARIQLEGRA
jgi:hypothetical protein